MKRSATVTAIIVLMTALLLSSCATTAGTAPSTAPQTSSAGTSTPPPQPSAAPEAANTENTEPPAGASSAGEHAWAQMNVNKLVFGGDIDAFFDVYKDTDSALDKLQPLLVSALFAAYDSDKMFFADDDPVDAEFMWTAVYHLVNDFEFERKGITQDGGSIIVPKDVMTGFFMDEFAAKSIPGIPESLNGLVALDKASGTYTLVSTGIGMNFVLSDIALSKASSAADPTGSASIRFDVQDYDGKILKTFCVEVVKASGSAFKYSVMAAYTVEPEATPSSVGLPNPMKESSAQELVDTIGISFHIPDGAENIRYFIIDSGDPKLAQAVFTLNGTEYTHRIQQMTGVTFTDISGAYYDWTSTENIKVSYCSGEVRWIEGKQGVCLWCDIVPGLAYSLYTETGATKEGLLDLANQLFVPAQGDVP